MNKEKKAPVRKIKYRMWNGISKKYHYDIENVFGCIEQQVMFDNSMESRGFTIGYNHHADGSVFEQFTGKTTRSGTEIYDGDKLQQSKDCYWVVKWSDSNCGWNCYQYVFSQDEDGEYSCKKSDTYPLGHSLIGLLTYNYEVIGNIHEESDINSIEGKENPNAS